MIKSEHKDGQTRGFAVYDEGYPGAPHACGGKRGDHGVLVRELYESKHKAPLWDSLTQQQQTDWDKAAETGILPGTPPDPGVLPGTPPDPGANVLPGTPPDPG
jgi:hypothetical protein